jgi:hypothetical protein
MHAERDRLAAARDSGIPWKRWGPYLSERQWGTVREDYSADGDAWNYFTHDQARSRAYRWGEDGLAGISDDRQQLCFALALWNGQDPILKERLFGLSNSEGNHGEDVKEYYYYLDSTPTHSYMKYLYKYPQAAFPYADLVETNRRRSRQEFEYELIDTGVFSENRYFDVFVEYAKGSPDDLLIQISVHNRGPDPAELHVLPTLWFRNQHSPAGADVPMLRRLSQCPPHGVIAATNPALGNRYLYCEGGAALLFTNNETNTQRLFGTPNPTPYVKDGINDYIVHGRKDAVDPQQQGTKACPHYHVTVPAGVRKSFACVSRKPARLISRAVTSRQVRRSAAISGRPWLRAGRRPTNSMPPSSPRPSGPTRPTSCARPWQACCGASSTTTTTLPGGFGSTVWNPTGSRNAPRPGTTTGTTCTTPTSSRCRTSGSTRGTLVQHQLELLLAEIVIHKRQCQDMKRQVPGGLRCRPF